MRAALIILWGGLYILYFQVYDFTSLTYDDPSYLSQHVVADTPVMSMSFWYTLFSSTSVNLWTPFTDVSHQILFRISAAPQLHVTFNVLLHGLNASLLFLCVRRVTECKLTALALCLLFAWHPVTVESVAWISGRKDVLCTFFMMLAVLNYLKSDVQKPPSRRSNIIFFTIAACLSKPIGFTLPFILLFLDYWPLRRKTPIKNLVIEKSTLWFISTLSLVITVIVQSSGTQSMNDERNILVRCFEALWAILKSLHSIIFPNNLHFVYSNPEQLSLGLIITTITTLSLLSGLLYWKRERFRFFITGGLWFFITLGPTLGLLRAGNNLAADRYSYLPLLGLAIGLAGALSLPLSKKEKSITLGILFTITFTLSIVSFHQISHWRSQEALFSNVIKNDPNNTIASIELANIAFQNNDDNKAMNLIYPIIKKAPNDPGAQLILGHIAYKNQNYQDAYKHFEIAASTRLYDPFIQERLAASAHGNGDLEKTRQHMSSALELAGPIDKNLELEKKWNLIFSTNLPQNSK